MTQPEKVVEAAPYDWEAATEETIAACGGNARAAVTALLITNDALERELALAMPVVSYGFSRGWHHKRQQGEAD
jgi:hypothetical protein